MTIKNVKALKRFTYIGLSLSSLILFQEGQVFGMESGEYKSLRTTRSQPKGKSDYRETHNAMAKKYNRPEHIIPDRSSSRKRKERNENHEEYDRFHKYAKTDEPTLFEWLWNMGETVGESINELTGPRNPEDDGIDFVHRTLDRGAELIKNDELRNFTKETVDDGFKTFYSK